MAVYATAPISGAHLNPAVTIALASLGLFPWSEVPIYIAAQFLGAFMGAVITYLAYLKQWGSNRKLGIEIGSF